MKNLKVNSQHTEFAKLSQGVRITEILTLGDHKCKIVIERDSYDKQSSAEIKIWSKEALAWNFLASVHYSNMNAVKNGSQFDTQAKFVIVSSADRAELINKASIILA
jgi:hypothetical protein